MRIVQAHAIVTVVVGTDGELYLEDTLLAVLGEGIEVVVQIVLQSQVLTLRAETILDHILQDRLRGSQITLLHEHLRLQRLGGCLVGATYLRLSLRQTGDRFINIS